MLLSRRPPIKAKYRTRQASARLRHLDARNLTHGGFDVLCSRLRTRSSHFWCDLLDGRTLNDHQPARARARRSRTAEGTLPRRGARFVRVHYQPGSRHQHHTRASADSPGSIGTAARMDRSEAAAGRDPAFLSRALLSPDQVPREQSEPLIEPRVSRYPRNGERAVDRDPGVDGAQAFLAIT